MFKFRMLKTGLMALFCALACTLPLAAHALEDSPRAIKISAGPLFSALDELSKQSNVELVYRKDQLRGMRTQGLSGTFSTREAVKKLIEGRALRLSTDPSTGAMLITLADSSADAAQTDRMRLASAGLQPAMQQVTGEENVRDSSAAPVGNGAEAAEAPETRGIPEMLVKGNRSSNIDIQRTEDDVQPYVVFTADDIEHSMAGSLDQFLMTHLTMNTSRLVSTDITTQATVMNGNLSSIDLRGLGSSQTLILVNGRRIPNVSSRSELAQSDINGIPMSSVARIEILPSTAGGIYGGGATGGVINIILKNDYHGIEINGRYDGTFRGDATQRVLEANSGFSLENGRTTVMLSGSYRDSEPLAQGDREFPFRGRQELLDRGLAYSLQAAPLGSTSNIRSSNGSPLVLAASGRSLGSPITYVPKGYAGPSSDGGLALIANAGKYNLEWPEGSQGLGKALAGAPTVNSLRLNLRRNFTDRIDAFLDASRTENNTKANYATFPQTATVQPNTPNNPFTQAIVVRFPANDFDYSTDILTESMTLNATAGVIVRLPHQWTVQGEYGWGLSESGYMANQVGAYQVFEPAMRSGALNILRDVSVYPLDYSPYVGSQEFTATYPKSPGTDLRNTALRLAGPVFDLPGGPVALSTLLERRKDVLRGSISQSYEVPTDTFEYYYSPPRSRTSESAYAELTAPLFSAANAKTLLHGLDLQASYRLDRVGARTATNTTQSSFRLLSLDDPLPTPSYQANSVTANQYTLGLRYQPLPSLALRVSNAVGILPPSLNQLVPGVRLNFNSTSLDYQRGNLPIGVIAEYRSSGHEGLLPEQSDSWSAGAIFTPSFLPGLRMSLDYTLIQKTDEISSLGGTLEAVERIYGEARIRRAALTAADQALGYTAGKIVYQDQGLTNIARSKVEAYDFRIDYRWDTSYGSFRANVLATYQAHLQRQPLVTSALMEYMGFLDGPLQWRANGGLTWDRGAWTLGWNTQYFDAFSIYDTNSSASLRASRLLYQGADHIPYQIYHDLSFKYRIDEAPRWGGAFARSEILVGISNVLDTAPPLALYMASIQSGATALAGYAAPYGDTRMRRYSISVRKNFQ